MSFGSAVKSMMIPSIWFFYIAYILFFFISLYYFAFDHILVSTFSLQILMTKWISPSAAFRLLTDDYANTTLCYHITADKVLVTSSNNRVLFDVRTLPFTLSLLLSYFFAFALPLYPSLSLSLYKRQELNKKILILAEERNRTTVCKNKCSLNKKKLKYFVKCLLAAKIAVDITEWKKEIQGGI